MKSIIIAGPSGSGKGTLTDMLMQDKRFSKKISTTTRKKRDGEVEGVDKYFVTRAVFEEMISENKFLEYSTVHGEYYGTTKESLLNACKEGIPIIELDINNIGIMLVSECLHIWISPPSKKIMIDRLKSRGTETDDEMNTRIKSAEEEILFFELNKHIFDHVIINDDINDAFNQMKTAIESWI